MGIWKMYAITFVEIIIFLVVGFLLTQKVLSNIYESAGIAYLGNVGVVWFGLSFLLFCLYTLFRTYILSKRSPLLNERITSITFWIVFIWSAYSVFSPFVKGEI
ncbi:hypothetical protein BpOF4_21689 (plasmid) [Alkalihalophilus pseudofirmus OF4]|uniref:Uncharacterized protein n=1 Tax=Alkalihalophilus pseudofirmus (strain ATCC BAA-2126 / JCM 17055 / OF4) TaxID=398511 RepID=D3G1V7_ALKPO|nr:hypothetical protein BpOF4_21689 [Alkalihalophilus pseudofirmus OF4]